MARPLCAMVLFYTAGVTAEVARTTPSDRPTASGSMRDAWEVVVCNGCHHFALLNDGRDDALDRELGTCTLDGERWNRCSGAYRPAHAIARNFVHI